MIVVSGTAADDDLLVWKFGGGDGDDPLDQRRLGHAPLEPGKK